MLRILTLFILSLATAGWLWVVVVVGFATQGTVLEIGFPVIAITSTVFLAFGLPAFMLALKRKLLWLAPFLAILSLLGVVLVA